MGDASELRRKLRVGDKPVRLADIDPGVSHGWEKDDAEEATAKYLEQLTDLQDRLWAEHKHKVLVILQGIDAAGKDGTIRRVMTAFNPQGTPVASFKQPTPEELAHDFLWRIHKRVPGAGEIGIFNRSHYEDVLVVRVHDLVPRKLWKERYGHIADFEELLAEHGTIVLKYFLHISKKEQKKRLLERERSPLAAWKLNPNDWKERAHWDEYTEAYEDAISSTAAPGAPWIVVPADSKWYRDLVVAESLVEALRRHRRHWQSTLEKVGRARRADLAAYRQQK
jgi:PPK2 family polyphosphate:nucleotide phosphotransferase